MDYKVRYIDSDSCIQTVEISSDTPLTVQEATEAIQEALENSGVYVSDIAILDIKKKGWW